MTLPEEHAARIFQAAITEQRAGELLEALFEGASATVDRGSGKLVLVPAAQLGMFSQ